MTSVMIVDAYKSSLVMTSEVFKDKILGVDIDIARSGEECLEKLEEKSSYDMLVVDFDLPDTDGICLVKLLRQRVSVPILLTAYLNNNIKDAIQDELFAYDDVSKVISKPINPDILFDMINNFLIERKRFQKRYASTLSAMLVGKGEGRGKRSPKVKGDLINISIGGALIKLEDTCKMKIGDEVGINISLNNEEASNREVISAGVAKLKAKIAWADKSKKQAGVYFDKLSDRHRKAIESILKNSTEVL